MAARVLYAMPPRKAKRWTEADVNADTETAVAAVFDRLFGLTMEVDPERPAHEPDYRPRLVRLADDGKVAWVRFYNEHATEQAELSGGLSAAWSKLEGYAARLALVVHLTRWAAGDTCYAIRRGSMKRASRRVWCWPGGSVTSPTRLCDPVRK